MDIENLKRELEVRSETEVARLIVDQVDTSSWKEFGAFFQAPLSHDLYYQWTSTWPAYPDGIRHAAQACFLAVTSVDREKAIAALRADLLKLRHTQSVEVKAFLAKPSTIPLVRPIKEGETADAEIVNELGPPKPGKRYYVAFCFLHAVEVVDRYNDDRDKPFVKAVDIKRLRELLIDHAANEGEIGKSVD